jgi:hypothetical protein
VRTGEGGRDTAFDEAAQTREPDGRQATGRWHEDAQEFRGVGGLLICLHTAPHTVIVIVIVIIKTGIPAVRGLCLLAWHLERTSS